MKSEYVGRYTDYGLKLFPSVEPKLRLITVDAGPAFGQLNVYLKQDNQDIKDAKKQLLSILLR